MSFINTAISAIVASLQAAPAVSSNIGRVKLRPLAFSVQQAVVVRPARAVVAQSSQTSGYPITWSTAIQIECYAKSTAATAPDVAVDALLQTVYARLMADITLGGAVVELEPISIECDFDVDADQTTCATITFTALQRVDAASLN